MTRTDALIRENLELIKEYIEDNALDMRELKDRLAKLESNASNQSPPASFFTRFLNHFNSPATHSTAPKELS